MVRRILPALAAALAFTACTSPIFDPAASAAVATMRASVLVAESTPTKGPDFDTDGEPDFDLYRDTLTFLPERWGGSIDPGAGFVIRQKDVDTWNQVFYQWWDGDSLEWMGTPAGFESPRDVPWRWPVTLKNGSSLGAIIFESGDYDTNAERLYADSVGGTSYWSPAYGSYNFESNVQSDIGFPALPVIVGASVNADPLPGQDRLHVLVRDGPNFAEAEALFGDTGVGVYSAVYGPGVTYPLAFLGQPRHIAYFRDADPPSPRSFAQWREWDGTWRTWVWAGPPGPVDIDEATAIDHRIDAVLSQDAGPSPASYLLSTEDGIARIYRYDGIGTESLVAVFGLGTLKYIGEMYRGGVWEVLFSRIMVDYGTRLFHFEIRAIATADLIPTFAP